MGPLRCVEASVISELYSAFGDRRIPGQLTFCENCNTPEVERALHGELRTLPTHLVARYVWDAPSCIGTKDDIAYFIPRVLECALVNLKRLVIVELEQVFELLRRGSWRSWSQRQQHAVEAWIDALWSQHFGSYQTPLDVNGLVYGTCLAYDSLAPQITNWTTSSEPFALRRLVEFILANQWLIPTNNLRSTWWEHTPLLRADVLFWLRGDDVIGFLTVGALDDPKLTNEAQSALDVVGSQ